MRLCKLSSVCRSRALGFGFFWPEQTLGSLSAVGSVFCSPPAPAGDLLCDSRAAPTLPPRLQLGRERLTVAVCRRGANSSCLSELKTAAAAAGDTFVEQRPTQIENKKPQKKSSIRSGSEPRPRTANWIR